MKVKELEKEFEKKGVKYEQILKNNVFVLYKCTNKEFHGCYYEIFKYKLTKPNPFDSGDWDMVEYYPSNEMFGVDGWCCSNVSIVKKVLKNHFEMGDYEIEYYFSQNPCLV